MDVPLHGDVDHVHRVLEFLGDVDAVLLAEDHDAHVVLVSTLRRFLYSLIVKKKLVVVQGC